MSEQLTEEELAAAALAAEMDAEPEADQYRPNQKEWWTPERREEARQQTLKRQAEGKGRRRRGRPPGREKAPSTPAVELDVDKVIDEAVTNLQGVGGILTIVAPHTGVAIAGVQDESGNWIVRSRAKLAGDVLREQARRDARLLQWVDRFNSVFRYSAAGDVALSMAVAVAVDAGMDPDFGVQVVPGLPPIRPAALAIPDVLEFIEAQTAMQAQQPPGAANGAGPDAVPVEPEVIEGGVTET